MEFVLRQIHKAGIFSWLYVANLFFSFHIFTVHFIDSSFLSTFLERSQVGILFTAAFALTLFVLASLVPFLRAFGGYRTALIATTIDYLAVFGLATMSDPGVRTVLFTLHTMMVPVILFTLDIFFEHMDTDKENTGNARGIFLSIATIAALFSPALAGYLIGDLGHYERVYLVSALLLTPFLVVLILRFRAFSDPHYRRFLPLRTLATLRQQPDIVRVGYGQFLMRFYFAWNTIYLPLYLHEHIGLNWPEIGMVLFIMLVPYVFVEWPAGIIADTVLGEKELLIVGFLLAAVPTACLVLVTSHNVLVWGMILFVTRIGTALIESMTETYFFKKIDRDDTDIITVFRLLRPLAYTLAPLAATFVLFFTDMPHLWLVLAAVMLTGVWATARLADTK